MAKGLHALHLLRQDHEPVEQMFRRFERARDDLGRLPGDVDAGRGFPARPEQTGVGCLGGVFPGATAQPAAKWL